jgi:uncharacterized membrane-anchored protein
MINALRAWMAARSPPTNLVHIVVVTCQTAGIAFATARYVYDQRADAERREDQATLAALDRCSAYALHAEPAVLELETYKHDLELRESRRP